jgi:uncharacterized SAM-binding protein YcdF (DUF218 family)/glycosyltransferase involved in cell wall biosynthesis
VASLPVLPLGVVVAVKDYLIISSINWTENWQIHQLLATSLVASGHRVLFVENTGVRAPRFGDMGRILDRIKNWLKSTRGFFDVKENLTLFSPLFLPFPYSRIALWVNRYLLSNSILKWVRIRRYHSPIVISFLPTPLAQTLIDNLDPSLVIYFCADSMSSGSTGAAALKVHEDAFFKKADAVFCTSHALVEQAKLLAKRVYLYPAGVDFAKFAAALHRTEVPVDLSTIPKPIVGYVGSIRAVFDQSLLAYSAQSLPHVSFVLVGPEIANASPLHHHKNIHFMGKRLHDEVPSYIQGFDIALIPYIKNDFTDAIYPFKLNEYLAMGKPVVSTNLREVKLYIERHGDVLEIAQDPDDFVNKIRMALAESSAEHETQRIEAARQNSWEQRFSDICNTIEHLLDLKQTEQKPRWQERLTTLYRQGHIRIIKPLTLLGLSYLLLFYTPLLWLFSNGLVMRGTPIAAQAIVVFSGDGESGYVNTSYQKRAQDALTLYQAGHANRIVLSSGKGQSMSEAEVVRALLLKNGVPDSVISTVTPLPRSTQENIQFTAEHLTKHDIAKVIFVTAPYHSKRSALVWQKLAPHIQISPVSVVDTPSEEPRWHTRWQLAKVVAYEYAAIVYYWWKGWV